MTTVDDTVGYQLPSCPCAQYSVLKRRGPIFPRTEAANTVSNGSHDDYYPLNFIGNVSITDHEGTFVGHVLANTNKILQVRQLESRRIHIRGLVNAITSGISNGSGSSQNIPDLTSSSDYPGRSVSHLKSAVVEWSVKSRASRDDDSRLPNDSANGTPSHKICDSLSHNRSEEIDVHNLKQFPEMPAQTRKSSAARIDLTLALSPSDTTGKPPLAPGRRHRARISSSKSLDCFQDKTRGESAPRSRRFTKGSEPGPRSILTLDLPEKCCAVVTPPSRSRSIEDFAPERIPPTLCKKSHRVQDLAADNGWRLSMKRSASLSDLPSLSVSDDDEDEPMEKKVKLVSAPPPAENALPLLFRFNSLKFSWAASCRKLASAEAVDWDKIGDAVFVARPVSSPTFSDLSPRASAAPSSSARCGSSTAPAPPVTFSLKATALQRLCAICSEQDRLRAQFISEVSKSLGVTVRKAASKLNNPYGANNLENLHVKSVEQIILTFQRLSMQQLERQEHELRWAIAVDGTSDPGNSSSSSSSSSNLRPKLSFRHTGMFSSALLFDRRAHQMIDDVEAALREVHPVNGRRQ